MANTYVNDSGTWRNIKGVYVKDSSIWRPIRNIYTNQSGTWRLVFGGNTGTETITEGAVFTGSFVASTKTLTVTSMTSGTIKIGHQLCVNTANTWPTASANPGAGFTSAIGAQTSGTTGGVGTYTLIPSADGFNDLSSRTLTTRALSASFTGTISGTTLTATFGTGQAQSTQGSIFVGAVITGTGVAAGTKITALGTGIGVSGTYTVSISQTVSSTTMVSTGANSGIWTVPDGVYSVAATVCGGSGGGGFAWLENNQYGRGGGGGGGSNPSTTTLTVNPGDSISYTIGIGGCRQQSSSRGATAITNAGASSVTYNASTTTAGGGGGGQGAPSLGTNGAGGAGGNGANAGATGTIVNPGAAGGTPTVSGGLTGGSGGTGWNDINPPVNDPDEPLNGFTGYISFTY
jgi:hypothetical protein